MSDGTTWQCQNAIAKYHLLQKILTPIPKPQHQNREVNGISVIGVSYTAFNNTNYNLPVYTKTGSFPKFEAYQDKMRVEDETKLSKLCYNINLYILYIVEQFLQFPRLTLYMYIFKIYIHILTFLFTYILTFF